MVFYDPADAGQVLALAGAADQAVVARPLVAGVGKVEITGNVGVEAQEIKQDVGADVEATLNLFFQDAPAFPSQA